MTVSLVATMDPNQPSGRPFTASSGSAIDPSVVAIDWLTWVMTAASHHHTSEAAIDAARGVFRLLTEQLWVAARTLLISQVSYDPSTTRSVAVHFGVGVLGNGDDVGIESRAVRAIVESQFNRPGMPSRFEACEPSEMLHRFADNTRTMTVRQRMVDVDDGDGGDVPVLMRWNPTVDPWASVLRLLAHQQQRIAIRVTALPTELTVSDRQAMNASLRAAARMHGEARSHSELITPAARAYATSSDVAASFSSPLLCGELAIVSDEQIPERLARSLASCFTSDSEVLRREGRTVVAPHAVMLGGFELQRDPALHVEALRLGVPLRGGLVQRELRDLWTLTEAPIGWPVPIGSPIPGLASDIRRPLAAGADLAETADGSGVFIGTDPTGRSVRVDDVVSRRHIAIHGRTGCGKTALLVDMMKRDLDAERGFLFIDPHSDAGHRVAAYAHKIGRAVHVIDLDLVATERLRFAPRLRDDGVNLSDVESHVRCFVEAVVSHLPSDWAGPRFAQTATANLLPACAHGLEVSEVIERLANPGEIDDLVDHPALPRWVADNLRARFSRTNHDAASVAEWTNSKFSPFFVGPARRLLAAPGDGLDAAAAVLGGTPVIVNLAGLPEADGRILGHVVLSLVTDAIIRRGATPHDEAPTRIYVDEAPRFHAHNLERLLTGGRKFGAALVLACQAVNQYDGHVSDQVLVAATQIVFAQTPAGASVMSRQLDMAYEDLVNQPDFHAYARIGHSPTFALATPRYVDDAIGEE